MTNYAVLAYPGHNRVFFKNSEHLSIAEIGSALRRFGIESSGVSSIKICGISFLSFDTSRTLDQTEIDLLYRLSPSYVVFQRDGENLIPLENKGFEFVGDDLSSILKYSGKTNELFTKMMINIAVLESDFDYNGTLLLDPICGKGTTLFEALSLGLNAYGVEINAKVVHEAAVFFKKYLETAKMKHELHSEKLSGANKSFMSNIDSFKFSKSRENFKTEAQNMALISGDTLNCPVFFKKGSINFVVGDLPYGIEHGNKSGNKTSRNPIDLLKPAIPIWADLLKKGGTLALSWNAFLLKRKDLEQIIQSAGLNILENGLDKLEHRVDQAIKRDVIFAKK